MATCNQIEYRAHPQVRVTLPEAIVLKKLSLNHYDARCRSHGDRGIIRSRTESF